MKVVLFVVTLIIALLIIITFVLIGPPDGLINNRDIDIEWKNFKQKYNREYDDSAENERRKQIYIKSKEFIEEHNKRYAKGLVSYMVGINQFADLTDREYIGAFNHDDDNDDNELNALEKHKNTLDSYNDYDVIIENNTNVDVEFEFVRQYINMTNDQFVAVRSNFLRYNFTDSQNLPDNVNWTAFGYDNPILDQGNCGSCYIFASLAAIEAHYFIKYKTLLQLSHQEILDCSLDLGNTGCSGGYIQIVYSYAMLYGVGLADKNPYIAKNSNECKVIKPRIFIKKQIIGKDTNEATLKEVIAKYGPVTSPINAGLRTFKFYKSGLYYDPMCTEEELEHGVATVGYGVTENGKDYWLVRNSFGKNWGDNGYMKLARNRDNQCGLATEFMFPQF